MISLKADIWAMALIRRAQAGGAFACLIRRGDGDAGAVLVKVRRGNESFSLYRAMRNMSGERVWWSKDYDNEHAVDDLINARIDDDPDLWIIEIEDRDGRHFLTEPIEPRK